MSPLEGRVALVTGASRGIGAAIALRLAQDGADIAFTYLDSDRHASEIAARVQPMGRRALSIRADSAESAAPARSVADCVVGLGRIDILVNNAGVFPSGQFAAVSIDELEHCLAVNVRAAFVATQAAVARMGEGGRVVMIGSSLAERVPLPGVALYAMSKAALGGLSRALARELGPCGITVNVVHPGSTDTDMNPASGDAAAAELPLIPLGRYGDPSDIAATVAHLVGPSGRHVTGATILVDGGASA